MTVMRRWYLGECFSECLKHVGAIQAAVKVDVELSSEVGQMTQLCVCVCVCVKVAGVATEHNYLPAIIIIRYQLLQHCFTAVCTVNIEANRVLYLYAVG